MKSEIRRPFEAGLSQEVPRTPAPGQHALLLSRASVSKRSVTLLAIVDRSRLQRAPRSLRQARAFGVTGPLTLPTGAWACVQAPAGKHDGRDFEGVHRGPLRQIMAGVGFVSSAVVRLGLVNDWAVETWALVVASQDSELRQRNVSAPSGPSAVESRTGFPARLHGICSTLAGGAPASEKA